MLVFLYNLMQLSCNLETSHPSYLDGVLVCILLLFNQEAEKCPGFFFFFFKCTFYCTLLSSRKFSSVIQVRHFSFDGVYMLTCHWAGWFLLGCEIIAQTLFIDRNLTANQGTASSPRFHCAFPSEKNSGYNGYCYGYCVPSRWTLGRSWSWTSYINVCS